MGSLYSGSKGKQDSAQGMNVEPYVKFFEGEGRGMRRETYGQLTELLRTGGVGARVPIIQQAVSSQQGALSDSLRGQRDDLARSGLLGTPFGQRQLASSEQAGRQQIAGIPSQMAQSMFGQAGELSSPVIGQILGAMSAQSTGRGRSKGTSIL